VTNLEQNVIFRVLEERYCVAKLPSDAPIPGPPDKATFWSLTIADEEISVVCPESEAPPGAEVERNWRCLKVQGPLEFSLKGVLVSLLAPLAEANVAVFATSTYDTDYILVKQYHLASALQALEAAGHRLMA